MDHYDMGTQVECGNGDFGKVVGWDGFGVYVVHMTITGKTLAWDESLVYAL